MKKNLVNLFALVAIAKEAKHNAFLPHKFASAFFQLRLRCKKFFTCYYKIVSCTIEIRFQKVRRDIIFFFIPATPTSQFTALHHGH